MKLFMGQPHLCVTWSWSSVSLSFSERQGSSRKYTPPPSVPIQRRSHDLSKRRTVTRVALRSRKKAGVRSCIIFNQGTGRDTFNLERNMTQPWKNNHKVSQWCASLGNVGFFGTYSGKKNNGCTSWLITQWWMVWRLLKRNRIALLLVYQCYIPKPPTYLCLFCVWRQIERWSICSADCALFNLLIGTLMCVNAFKKADAA